MPEAPAIHLFGTQDNICENTDVKNYSLCIIGMLV